MSEFYFSDRERGARQRTEEMIPPKVWGALCRLITGKIDDDSFGFKFPAMCPDGAGPCGCDARSFRVILTAEIPELDEEQPLDPSHLPETAIILDLLEFCAQAVAKPVYGSFHSFFAHHHLDFDRETGLVDFVTSVNRLFARNGIAFELSPDGQARRLAPTGLREELAAAVFHTGDRETDKLLEIARRRILSQHPDDRQDAFPLQSAGVLLGFVRVRGSQEMVGWARRAGCGGGCRA